MKRVATYPEISEKTLIALGIKFEPLCGEYTHLDGSIRKLELVDVPFCSFKDRTGCWNPREYDLNLRNPIIINNPSALFHDMTTAVADANALLGVALRVLSKESEHREIKSLANISKSEQSIKIDLPIFLKKGEYRRNVTLEYVLYLEKSGVTMPSIFATTQGAVLGILHSYEILLSGEGSVFPTQRVSLGREEPLWSLQFLSVSDEDEMLDEDFSDVIQLVFNSDHKSFNQLQLDGAKISFFSLDILANAIHLLLLKFKTAYETKKSKGPVVQKGSVYQAIHWFVDGRGLGLNLDASPEVLSLEIRKKLEELLKNEMESLQ